MTTLLVDARAPFGSGLGRHLREMLSALSRLERFDSIILAGPSGELDQVRAEMSGVTQVIDLSWGRYDPRIPFAWGAIATQVGGPHQTWFPNWDGAWRKVAASGSAPVTTLHDLIQLDGSAPRERLRAVIAAPWMRRMMESSRAVVTVSEGSRAAIAARFPTQTHKVRVIPNGVAPIFLTSPSDGHELGDLGITGPYLLTVANKKPHKNLEMAIRAFARLGEGDAHLQLVMVGERFPHRIQLLQLARDLGVRDRLVELETLPDARLAAVYGGAEAFLFPSRQEGFGMVALEAMAAGAPVVAVDRAPIPEVVGDAAVLVPMDDDAAMAAAVTRLRTEARWRADRVAAGRARAAQFTWERSARALADVLCG
jgi:glycosyltransferase involved in cell wall biosynthesis